jgi:hypothetical protein
MRFEREQVTARPMETAGTLAEPAQPGELRVATRVVLPEAKVPAIHLTQASPSLHIPGAQAP